MRTKFKVWHKEEKRWLDYCVMLPSGRVGEIAESADVVCFKDRDVEVVFWTGLQDKNGKEIYEGDIVQDKFGGVGQIIFGNYEDKNGKYHRGWYACFSDGTQSEYPNTMFQEEIIGNIHEHGNLLKG